MHVANLINVVCQDIYICMHRLSSHLSAHANKCPRGPFLTISRNNCSVLSCHELITHTHFNVNSMFSKKIDKID